MYWLKLLILHKDFLFYFLSLSSSGLFNFCLFVFFSSFLLFFGFVLFVLFEVLICIIAANGALGTVACTVEAVGMTGILCH